MNFTKFTDFHDFGLKTVPNPYEFHYFSALGENDDVFDFPEKHEKNLKMMKFQNWKHKNHRKSDFCKVLTHVGAGKSAFSVFLRTSWKFTNNH